LLVHQANENADFLYLLQCWIEPEKSADKKISDKAIEVMRQWQNFLQPLAQGVVALIGQYQRCQQYQRCHTKGVKSCIATIDALFFNLLKLRSLQWRGH
jgi:hypothetical protein